MLGADHSLPVVPTPPGAPGIGLLRLPGMCQRSADPHGKAVFVGSHPDDIEIGAGATTALLAGLGYDVWCVYLTKGECGGDASIRVRESLDACARLGVSADHVAFGPFNDRQIPYSYEAIEFLERFCDGEVCAAFFPSTEETHQDHRNTSLSCITAFRKVPRLLAYESPSTTSGFTPNAFVDASHHLRKKWQALRCHKSQIEKCRMYLEYRSMRGLAGYRGSQIGVRFAEAFQTIRFLISPSGLC